MLVNLGGGQPNPEPKKSPKLPKTHQNRPCVYVQAKDPDLYTAAAPAPYRGHKRGGEGEGTPHVYR